MRQRSLSILSASAMLAPEKTRREAGGPRSEGQPRGVVCTYGAVAKFLGEGPEVWGWNLQKSDKKKAGR